MSAPLVSVVIPCLNAGPMLDPALKSVVRQTHPALEIVFVDNGSTDGSLNIASEVLSAHDRPFKIVSCPEKGASKARNFGLTFAAGAYIQWLDADDLLDADKIALQAAALEASSGYDVAYADFTERFRIPGSQRGERKTALAQEKDQILRILLGYWYPPHSYLWRRAAAERFAWNTTCSFGEDIEYVAMAALAGMRFLHVPGAHVVYNVWSTTQEARRVLPLERARSMEGVHARLKALARSLPRGALADRHWTLLDQDFRMWKLPRGSVSISKLDGRRVSIRQAGSGRTLDLRPREAAVAEALIDMGAACNTSRFARELLGRPNPPTDDPVFVVKTIQKLARAGFMVDMTDELEAEALADARKAGEGAAGAAPAVG